MTCEKRPASLEDAISLAAQAHKGQLDKAGAPYILHPLRLMLKMSTDKEMMAAVLHDVLEDTAHSSMSLKEEGYPADVIAAVEHLTRLDGETYAEFIERVKHNPLALKVKLADLEDNMDLSRLSNPSEKDFERLAKYKRAKQELLDHALKNNILIRPVRPDGR